MFSLILAAAVAVTAPQPATDKQVELLGEYAYMSGRCYINFTDYSKATFVQEIEPMKGSPLHELLSKLYYQGIQESRTEPLSNGTCVRVINAILKDLQADKRLAE